MSKTEAVTVEQVSAAEPAPSAPDAVSTVLSGVLSMVGLSAVADTAPTAPAESPLMWAMLAWARRQSGEATTEPASTARAVASTEQTEDQELGSVQQFAAFAAPAVNQAPTAAPTVTAPNESTGVVAGSINGSDADGNPVSYAVSGSGPTAGSVTVDPRTGAFTYTPTLAARLAATSTTAAAAAPMTDAFTVSVSDGQTSTAVTVRVPVLPAVLTNSGSAQVGGNPLGVAVSGTKIYVTNSASNTVSVVDQKTGAVSTINVLAVPTAVALSSDGRRAYVAGYNGMQVIDTTTNRVLHTVTTNGGQSYGIAVSPNGQRAYVTNTGTNTVSVINIAAATPTLVTSVGVGYTPAGVAVTPDGQRVFVANFYGNTVSVLNTATNTVVGSPIRVGANPAAVVLSPDGSRVYVTNLGSNSVSVINTAGTPAVIATITVGAQPLGLAISPDASLLYAANGTDTVSVIDTRTNTVVNTVTVDNAPEFNWHGMAVSADGRQIYISDMADRVLRTLTIGRPNTPPVAGTPTVGAPNTTTGTVTGTLNFTDPDGNPLTYTVSTQPTGGAVTVTAAGGYTFTPTQAARTQAAQSPGPDSTNFTVVASDGQASTSVIVTVPVAPAPVVNRAPVAGTPTVGAPSSTGVVTGTLRFTDPDGNALTYRVPTQPTSGTVTVTATGTYTYTPTQAARDAAAQTPGTDSASITVVASDGQASTPVTFSVPIAPASVTTSPPIFVGDYSTGNFSQWQVVQNRFWNSSGAGYTPSYAAQIVDDPTYGKAARFEVRPGDVPNFGGPERSEVQAGTDTGGTEGQVRWYQFATKFDPTFPQNHASLGWGLTNQWHADGPGSPPVGWFVDEKDNHWSLRIHKQSAPGQVMESFTIYDTPLNPGQWHDVKMEVLWSASDNKGYIRLWMNGERQTFKNGADTYHVRTLVPGTSTVYYKEGYYRAPIGRTGVVYHAGFRAARDEAGLLPRSGAQPTTPAPAPVDSGGTGTSSPAVGFPWWLLFI